MLNRPDVPLPWRLAVHGQSTHELLRFIEMEAFARDWDLADVQITASYQTCAWLIDALPNARVEKRDGRNVIIWPRPSGDIAIRYGDKEQKSIIASLHGERVIELVDGY